MIRVIYCHKEAIVSNWSRSKYLEVIPLIGSAALLSKEDDVRRWDFHKHTEAVEIVKCKQSC